MYKFFRNNYKKKMNSPPGTIFVDDSISDFFSVKIIEYNNTVFEEKKIESCKDIKKDLDEGIYRWIQVVGLGNIEEIKTLGEIFNIHPLVLEDILNSDQRPKIEGYKEYLSLFLKSISFDETKEEFNRENISIILFNNTVISFQQYDLPIFEHIKTRIKDHKGRIREEFSDYLLYILCDLIVDNYFIVLDSLGEKIADIEQDLVDNPTKSSLNSIQNLKRQMIIFRRSVWPLREVINSILRGDFSLFTSPTLLFIRDLYDHTIQIIDTIENFRELLSSMLDIYLSSISNKQNDIMKFLTIVSTIFIPITFIVGVYGMNFKYMPELEMVWAYPLTWFFMIFISVLSIFYFKRKGWL